MTNPPLIDRPSRKPMRNTKQGQQVQQSVSRRYHLGLASTGHFLQSSGDNAGIELRTVYKITIGTAVCFTSAIATLGFPIRSMEGIWRSPYHVNCMCSSYDFVVFRDGVITRYSDTHESVVQVGHYSARSDGRFDVVFDRDPAAPMKWVIRPRVSCWFAPHDHSPPGTAPPGSERLICRLFYRPLSTRRAEQIIAEGPRTNSNSYTNGKQSVP